MDDDSKSIGFGYTIVDNQNEDAPSGPPLLDHDESGYLQNFFDNPNNIDPSFLAGQAQRGHESMPPVGRHHSNNWMMEGNPQHPAYAAAAAAAHQASNANDYGTAMYGNSYGGHGHGHGHGHGQGHGRGRGPSDDVYAAARLLQGNHSYGNQKMDMYNLQQGSFNGGHQHQQQQRQQQLMPQQQQHQPAPAQQPQQQQQYSSTDNDQSRQQNPVKPERADPLRARPLNFGSDSKFRMNKYAAPKNEPWPDQELVAAVLAANPSGLQHNPWEPPQAKEGNDGSEGGAGARKQDEGSNDEDESGSESLKRKRSSAEDDDEKPKFKSAKRKGGPTSPGVSKSKREAVAQSKAAKENLSEEQKRANHIQSEQKRRNLIRQGFEDANRMVPELRTGGFSKSNMLLEAAKFMRELKAGNDRLDALVGILDKG